MKAERDVRRHSNRRNGRDPLLSGQEENVETQPECATLSFCVTAGHPGCLRLTLVVPIVHHPCRASYSTAGRVQVGHDNGAGWIQLQRATLCAWMDGSAAPTMAPYDSDPCGCSDEDNAIGTRQLDQLESRKSASEWKATLCLRLQPDTHRPGR